MLRYRRATGTLREDAHLSNPSDHERDVGAVGLIVCEDITLAPSGHVRVSFAPLGGHRESVDLEPDVFKRRLTALASVWEIPFLVPLFCTVTPSAHRLPDLPDWLSAVRLRGSSSDWIDIALARLDCVGLLTVSPGSPV